MVFLKRLITIALRRNFPVRKIQEASVRVNKQYIKCVELKMCVGGTATSSKITLNFLNTHSVKDHQVRR